MSVSSSIARTIRRLNLHGVVMALPIFGKALYDALSLEFERVDEYRQKVLDSTTPNLLMDSDTIDDYEDKYGIQSIMTATTEERIDRIIERAQMDGNGGPDWLQDQIQKAGFELYVIQNERNVSSVFQFGDFQFNDVQFGGAITYTDPRTIDGELVASSPNGNLGGQFDQFGDFQFGSDVQFGTLAENTAYPRPKGFTIGSDPDTWGYVFTLSPFPSGIATDTDDFLDVTEAEWDYLEKTVLQLKHLRNWAIVQVNII